MSRQQRLTLVATILGSTIVFLDSTVVNVALPAINEDLDAGLAGQQWVVEAYMLTLVALMLVGGSLGDQFGRRRTYVAGLVGFGVTSILCAVAPSSELLIAARGLQGMAGALLVPGSLAIVAATFEGAARGKAVGTWTAWTGIATVVGPAGGGALIELLSWRAIFWINIPLIAVTVALTLRAVGESRDPEANRGIDLAGIGLSAVGLGGPVFALIEQPTHGWGDPLVWAPMVVGVACFGLFLLREARARHPMLDLTLFRIRNFWVANLTTLTAYAGLIGGLFFVGLFLQQVCDYSPLEAGLATTPISVILFVLSPRFGRMASSTGPRLPMCGGPIVAGLGLIALMRVGPSPDYLTDVLPGLIVFGLGLAATVAPLTATVLDSVEERHVGIASGVNNGISRVAGLLAIAVLGAVISASFGSQLDSNLESSAPPPAAATPAATAAVPAAAQAVPAPRAVAVYTGHSGISRHALTIPRPPVAVYTGHSGISRHGVAAGEGLGPEAAAAVEDAKAQPLAVPDTSGLAPAEAARVEAASIDASTSAFHLGLLIGGLLMIAGGIVAGLGIQNPPRDTTVAAVPAGGAALAGECGHDCDPAQPTPAPTGDHA